MKVAQLCLTLCDPVDYTVHGILQARILEYVAVPFSRGSSQPRDQTQGSNPGLLHYRQILYQLRQKGSPEYTDELYKKGLNDPENHGGVIIHLEPDILEYEVKWALGSITTNKASGDNGFQMNYLKS